MTNRTYYIVKLKCKYNDTSRFEIKDVDAWLGFTNEGGGFYQVTECKERSHKFDQPPKRSFIMSDYIGPWYYKIKDYEIFEVTETFSFTERKLS